jgi:hypothetical protein
VKWLTLCAVLTTSLFLPHLAAQTVKEDTGLDLLNKCQPLTRTPMNLSNSEHGDAEYCMGYLLGMKDMLTAWTVTDEHFKQQGRSTMCVPYEATTAELIRVVIKFLNDHPTKLHDQAGAVVINAFRDAYPCK